VTDLSVNVESLSNIVATTSYNLDSLDNVVTDLSINIESLSNIVGTVDDYSIVTKSNLVTFSNDVIDFINTLVFGIQTYTNAGDLFSYLQSVMTSNL